MKKLKYKILVFLLRLLKLPEVKGNGILTNNSYFANQLDYLINYNKELLRDNKYFMKENNRLEEENKQLFDRLKYYKNLSEI